MANICSNTLYAYSEDRDNLIAILDYFHNSEFNYYNTEDNGNVVEIEFDSNWNFPISAMEELYNFIPNKEDIYMRCLSVEYGCMYHALWACDEEGWTEY